MKSKHKILLIGPVKQKNQPLTVGGATISFGYLLEYALQSDSNIRYVVINSSTSKIVSYIYTIRGFLKNIFWSNVVMLNVSAAGLKYLAPLLYLIAMVFRKKITLRVFGGDLIEIYEQCPLILRVLIRNSIFKADIVYLQTKRLIKYFSKGLIHAENIKWLPTSRKRYSTSYRYKEYQRKFIFIGHIKKEKGIEIIHKAFQALGKEYQIDFYGPMIEDKYQSVLGSQYKGVLDSKEVNKTLDKYDFLCFPTFWKGEGYPGVVIESYSVGIPVIVSDWISLPEIVEHGKTGLIVKAKSVGSLVTAIQSINKESHRTMSEQAFEEFRLFDSDLINQELLNQMEGLKKNL